MLSGSIFQALKETQITDIIREHQPLEFILHWFGSRLPKGRTPYTLRRISDARTGWNSRQWTQQSLPVDGWWQCTGGMRRGWHGEYT